MHLVLYRLIGEVKQDSNLTIKNGQEARGRRKWFLGSLFVMPVFRSKSGLRDWSDVVNPYGPLLMGRTPVCNTKVRTMLCGIVLFVSQLCCLRFRLRHWLGLLQCGVYPRSAKGIPLCQERSENSQNAETLYSPSC